MGEGRPLHRDSEAGLGENPGLISGRAGDPYPVLAGLLLIGFGLLINRGQRIDTYRSTIGLPWDRMDISSMNRVFRRMD